MHNQFNPDMLELARGARGMTQAEAAKAAAVSQALLSKIENRLIPASEDVAERLANALNFPVPFFYQDERAHGFPHYHHRKRASLGVKALAKLHATINIRRQHIAKLFRSFDQQPDKPVPSIDLDEKQLSPGDVARLVREYWMLPRGPIDSVTDVIEQAGGIVVQTDLGTSLIDGISFRHKSLPPIFVMNEGVPGDRYRFSLAHELGHMIMHQRALESDETLESQADEFAANFLMPAAEVRPHLVPTTIEKLGRAKLYWKVSIKALIRRAKDLKLISPDDYRRLSINYSKAGYGRGEPFSLPVEKPCLLDQMIDFHVNDLRYSFDDLANLLLADSAEIREMYAPKARLRVVS